MVWKGGVAANSQDVAAVVNLNWKVAGIGDFDGDGKSDMLWRNGVSGESIIWKSGSAAMPMDVASVPNTAWSLVAVGDYDGDGKSDLLWRNSSTGDGLIWPGTSASTTQGVVAVSNPNWQVVPGSVHQLGETGVRTLAVPADTLVGFGRLAKRVETEEGEGGNGAVAAGKAAAEADPFDLGVRAQIADILYAETGPRFDGWLHEHALLTSDYLLA